MVTGCDGTDPALVNIQGCMEGPGTFPEPAAPMGAGDGRGRRPSWVLALNHLSIFINMQMSSSDGSPLPAGVNYLTWRR